MSIADSKKDIFNKISAFTSLKDNSSFDIKSLHSSMKSVNNKKNAISFLLDVMKSMVGTDALKEITGELVGSFIDKTEPFIRESLKKQLVQFNADDKLPDNFISDGINVDVSKIDHGGKLRINPETDLGRITYGKAVDSFDKSMFNAIRTEQPTIYNEVTLTYKSATDMVNIKPNGSLNIGEFFTNYIDKTKLVNKEEIVSEAIDSIFGTITITKKKTENAINEELRTNKMLENIINTDEAVLSENDLTEIEKKSKELYKGYLNNDFCCGEIIIKISTDDLVVLVDQLGTDPFTIGNNISDIVINKSEENQLNENKDTIKDNFLEKFINSLILALVKKATMSPEIKMLMSIANSLQGNNFNENINDYMKNNSIVIKCIVKSLISEATDFIFKKTTSYLSKLLEPVIKKMLKEKIKQYTGILKSLF